MKEITKIRIYLIIILTIIGIFGTIINHWIGAIITILSLTMIIFV